MTTTGTYSNYGSVFHFPSGTAYAAVVLDYPEVKEDAIEITNNTSGNVSEFIYSNLVRLSPFSISLLGRPGIYSTFRTHQTNRTIGSCVLSDAVETYTFQGLITNVKHEPSDQQKPDAAKITITVQPTGGMSV